MADYLAHHGVKGMKWGVRRYQNADGTRTTLGKKRERKDYTAAEKAKREQTKKVLVRAGMAAAFAGILYMNNKEFVDAFIREQSKSAAVTSAAKAASREAAKKAAQKEFVELNKERIMNDPLLFKKYRTALSDTDQVAAITGFGRAQAADKAVQERIRRGGNYINAVLSTANAVSAAYNFKNQKIVQDAVKAHQEQKKNDDRKS